MLPHFGPWRLSDISRQSVQEWVHLLSTTPPVGRGKPLAPASVQKAHQVLSKVLEAAVRDERLGLNPARGVDLPRIPDDEARFLTPDELLVLEEAMPDAYKVLIPFLADTGLRIGEAAGLRWRDVDLTAGTVQVREVLVEVRGKAIFGPPKTSAGRRLVPTLTEETAERLPRGTPDGFVFSGPRGGPLRPSLFRRRVWHLAIDEVEGLGTPTPTPHALRPTAVAHWIASGVEPYRLAKWAGHRSVATIYRVYGHLLDNDATAEREALSLMRATARERRENAKNVVQLRQRSR